MFKLKLARNEKVFFACLYRSLTRLTVEELDLLLVFIV